MLRKKILALAGLAIALSTVSCNKTVDEIITEQPPQEQSKSFVQFKAGGVNLDGKQYYAIVDIENKNGETVVSNKKLTLDYIQGEYKTDKVELPKGDYRLAKFVVVRSSDTAVFATPRAGSAKAALITKPLKLDFTISTGGVALLATEALKVNPSDDATAFGYTVTDFGFFPSLALKLKLSLTIGGVLFDNLPGKIEIDAIDNQDNHWTRQIDLSPGQMSFRVPENFTQYKFRVIKWNSTLEKTYSRAELSENFAIEMTAAKNAKKLVKEFTFTELATGLRADSRAEYTYNGLGLTQAHYYQRLPQYQDLQLTMVNKFHYLFNQVDTIRRFDGTGMQTGFTAFTYTAGKITSIHNTSYDQQTFAAVHHGGTAAEPELNIDYLFSNGQSMEYVMKYRNQNKISYSARSSTGAGGVGTYEYDNNINPYYLMQYPDLYFSNTSKNNKIIEQTGSVGGFPTVVPYKMEYEYDEDGYPTVLYTSYKGYTTGEHLYRTKKVFQYQS